jgi:hypothetical protein
MDTGRHSFEYAMYLLVRRNYIATALGGIALAVPLSLTIRPIFAASESSAAHKIGF